mgnify:CR=1 FL=1
MQIRGRHNSNIEVTNNGKEIKVQIFVRGSKTFCNLSPTKAELLVKELNKNIQLCEEEEK